MITSAAAPPTLTVPCLWPDGTVVILASGPSLSQADIDACGDRAHVLAIKDSIRLAPWAPVLYACDRRWWRAHPETASYTGLKFGLESVPGRPDVDVLRNTGETGLELDPTGLRTGRNSGYQAINLAVHLGARRILLLGFDMQPDAHGQHRWFGSHSYGGQAPPYILFRERMETIVEPLRERGVTVINCTPGSALDAFERRPLREALA
jgi:hypothetical protein